MNTKYGQRIKLAMVSRAIFTLFVFSLWLVCARISGLEILEMQIC